VDPDAPAPRIITYHEISELPSPDRYVVDRVRLEEHLRVVAEAAARDGHPGARVTFDDGHRSNHRYVPPLLERFGLRAIFFVTAGHVGIRPDCLSWSQLAELSAAGHDVQAHGWSHAALTHCDDAQLHEELVRPKEALESQLGTEVDALSAPHGRWDARVLAAAARAGYRRVYVSDPWLSPRPQTGVRLQGRYMVRNATTPAQLERLLRLRGVASLWPRTAYQAKEAARRLVGDELYHRLWHLLARRHGTHDLTSAD
jgi:peptidoglycan/xylan/chitin deacetylase (PgdA/CDA1 family)